MLSFIWDITQWNRLDIKNATGEKPNQRTWYLYALWKKIDTLGAHNTMHLSIDWISCQTIPPLIMDADWFQSIVFIVPPSIFLSGFFAHTFFIYLQKCISNHEIKQPSKFQSNPSLIASQSTFEINNCWLSTVLLLLFIVSFYTSSV